MIWVLAAGTSLFIVLNFFEWFIFKFPVSPRIKIALALTVILSAIYFLDL